jgi:dTDP-4-amino-4,6-dideoxygalactose transaminase
MQPVNIPFFGIDRQYNAHREEILDATDRVLRSGQVMGGNNTAEFETWLAKRNKCKYAITVHSGTNALEILANYYLTYLDRTGASNNPTVAIPSFTFPATANAFVRAGWNVKLLDSDNYGLCRLGNNPVFDLYVMVGIFGHSVEDLYDRAWIGAHNVVEDGAQHWLALGCQRYANTAISFDPTKNLGNYGNGGALVTNEHDLYDFARRWRNHGKGSATTSTGSNSRMSEIDCAQMLIKTKYIDSWQKRRGDIAAYWMERLNEAGIRTLIDRKNFDDHCYHKFVIDIDQRNRLTDRLKYRGISTRIHYQTPLHEMNCFANTDKPDLFASASSLSRRVLSLPIYPELTDLEIEYIADQVIDCASD